MVHNWDGVGVEDGHEDDRMRMMEVSVPLDWRWPKAPWRKHTLTRTEGRLGGQGESWKLRNQRQ